MSLYRSKLLFSLLVLGLISCGQNATPQSAKKTHSPQVESGRISPSDFDLPMHLNPVLSGNFGEIRYNHFHSGIDFKTEHSIGHAIYSIGDGWVSRIRISNYGFGYALYIDHPNGFTSVYGHLQKFSPTVADYAKKLQYKNENFELDTLLKPGLIPVKRGQLVAYSGNAGVSSAPHLHFEIRDTQTEETIDPLLWYSNRINDTTRPQFKKLALYAIENEGVLSSGKEKALLTPIHRNAGEWGIKDPLPSAWGKVGVGMNAYDYMNGTGNIYGICSIRLYLENEMIFQQDMSRFAFNQTRYVNSMTDYELRKRNGTLILKSFLDPENKLKVYLTAKNKGYIQINEEKIYHLRYEIKDRAGNTTNLPFVIEGKKMDIPVHPKGKNSIEPWLPKHIHTNDLEMDLPAGTLYKSIRLEESQKPSTYYSDIYQLHNEWTPVHQAIAVKLRIQRDELENKKAYYLARENEYGIFKYAGGTYSKGFIQGFIRDFGNYTVKADTVPPKIVGLNLENAVKNRLFRIRISDEASGIKSWYGSIDGTWILFEFDGATSQLKYQFDDSRLTKGKEHQLFLRVTDACGNESILKRNFNY